MISIQQQCLNLALLLCLFQSSLAFQPQSFSLNRQTPTLKAIVDPNDFSSAATSLSHPELPALLSTMLSTTIQQAHGHSNPIFGPPDPILSAGKSIAPSARALTEMGITHSNSVTDLVPDASQEFQDYVKALISRGDKILNSKDIVVKGGDSLPGFYETKGILPKRGPLPESPESFEAELKWALNYFKIMNQLPLAAFWYAILEFSFIRPNVEMYKEDIDADPVGAAVDTISVFGVRCFAIAIVTIVLVVFNG